MNIASGTQIGRYTIDSLIGEGGMGQVYKGRDDRLGRFVAIKILPPELSERPDVLARFEREAHTISKLSHPHICAIFDVGESGGTFYLVMELLEGETLAARIARGPLPTQQVLRYGSEIAEALEAAHQQKIVHRDLKPGNVMLTAGGVKLLDFGIAKLIDPLTFSGGSDPSAAPTAANPLTIDGSILGTLPYMAPEQLNSQPIDGRTDIFALGAVLYEMATGKRAFPGTSQANVIAGIMHSDPPPIAATQTLSPASLERILRPCLAKDPADRWQTAGDVARQLRALAASSPDVPVIGASDRKPLLWKMLFFGLLLITAVAAVFLALQRTGSRQRRLLHTSILLPDDQVLVTQSKGRVGTIAISRDGSRIVYLAVRRGSATLFLRSLDSSEAVALAGTEGADSAFFSPDGSSVGFFADNKLKVLSLSGGAVADRCDAPGPRRGGTWLDDGSIVFSGQPGAGLYILRNGARTAERLTRVAPDEAGHVFPQILPGGRFVLFVAEVDGKPFDQARIAELDLRSGGTHTVINGGTSPVYSDPDRLYFVRDGRLLSTRIDAKTGAVSGAVAEVVRPVLSVPGTGASFFDVARDGTIVYVPYTSDIFNSRLVWVDRSGRSQVIAAEAREYAAPRVSPDGTRLLVQVTAANDDIWIHDLTRDSRSRLTFTSENLFPVWMPDGASFIFSRFRDGAPAIYRTSTDGSGQPGKILGADMALFPSSVSADGKTLAFTRIGRESGSDVGLLTLDAAHAERMLVATTFNETTPAISPDGRWVAYASDDSGRQEVYVQPAGGSGSRTQMSTDGGTEPVWNHAGDTLFYRNGDRVMSVAVTFGSTLLAGSPVVLFTGDFEKLAEEGISTVVARDYDVAPDDRQFVFLQHDPAQPRNIRRFDLLVRH